MILTVDIGNTSITIGVFSESANPVDSNCRPLHRFKLSSTSNKSYDEYAAAILSILTLNGIDQNKINGAIIGSVVPYLSDIIKSALSQLIRCRILIVGSGIKSGLNIRIDNPAQLGADLVANSVAAIARHRLPALIFDYGTATTISIIDEGGIFSGTVIMPGLRMSIDALANYTALLSFVSLDTPPTLIGKNSQNSILSGVINGAAIQMDGFIQKFLNEYGMPQDTVIIATGGLAKYVIPLCSYPVVSEPDLTLLGLLQLYKINMAKRQR
ncbi:MAG: type III pantothenate kinase [Clostridiales bacterium]|nr:type III pantothenate kinase [Clostridiales bacterium]